MRREEKGFHDHMTSKATPTEQAAEMRRVAEAALAKLPSGKASGSPEQCAQAGPSGQGQTIHELRVHQIELEMQNEELLHAHADLEASRARYFDLYDLAPVGYLILGEAGQVLEANLAASALLGLPRSQLARGQMTRFIHTEDSDTYYLMQKRLLETGQPQDCELRMVKSDGTSLWARMEASATLADGETPLCRIAISDLTERKRAEEAVRAASVYSRNLIEVSLDPLVTISAEGKITDVNTATEKITGLDRKRLIGSDFVDYFTEPKMARAGLMKAFSDGKAIDYPLVIQHTSGTTTPVLYNASVYRDTAGNVLGVFAAARDITDRKRAEEALQEKCAEMERFTYAVSHDLKSPLVTIQTFLGYLEKDIRAMDAEAAAKDLNHIHRAADKMGKMLHELLELARIGHKKNSSEAVPLQEIVQEALDLVAGQIASRRVEVKVTQEPVWLTGSRPRLVQAFQNLVDNAVKFLGDQPAPRVEIGMELEGSEIVLFVRDNGKGIEPSQQSKLFGLFEKLDPGTHGSGIGLALTKRIVEEHGGEILVISDGLGKGTTFRFTLANSQLR
ncbi:MAG: PAS domain-containing sensor histidine kinase [Verrucomicrobiae bacterium]